jgi:hypothetical protein
MIKTHTETNMLLLALVSPNYAKEICATTPITSIDVTSKSGKVLLAVLQHFSAEFRHFDKADKITKQTLLGIVSDDIKDHAIEVYDYAYTDEGKSHLLGLLSNVISA